MSPLFRRASADVTVPEPQVPEQSGASMGKVGGKGRPTPKRKDARRRVVEPPKNSKEARQRMREKMRAERTERMEGARRGEDRFLLARDRGPVRRLVRDIIDSRRNVGPLFFTGVLVVVIFTSGNWDPRVRLAATFLWMVLIVLLILDGVIIGRKVSRLVKERFPDTKEKTRSLILYGVLRSVSFRKIRNPNPLVKPGAEI